MFILSIDQGTTSTRAIVYDAAGSKLGQAAKELTQYYPQPGWVEHDPEEIWNAVRETVPAALTEAQIEPRQIAGIGVTNQRETVVLWDRVSGMPLARAIVWQDRRTTSFCRELQSDNRWLNERTGLVLDPYFSATKIRWLLDANPDWRARAQRGELACGTIDSFLIWRLTGGRHVTDVTNASRTLLLNLVNRTWDDELCQYFNVPRSLLPTVLPSAAEFGFTRGLDFLPDGLALAGVAGDQQAALFGQAAFEAGESKCTYGTGAFFLLHTGASPVLSKHGLLTTVAAMPDAAPQYAIEGAVFIAGAAVQWLRDGLRLFGTAEASERLAQEADPEQPTMFVPSFVGLGAPHWVPEARAALFGLTRNTGPAELARATLEGVAFQVADLIEAAGHDAATPLSELRVDGGMSRNAWFLQTQANVLGLPVLQAQHSESTALGAAFLAGLQSKVWRSLDDLRRIAAGSRRFEPAWPVEEQRKRGQQWKRAVRAVIDYYTSSSESR